MKLIDKIKRSIKNKLVAAFIAPLIVIVLFMSIFYPARQKNQTMASIEVQVKTLSEMLAFSVGAGLNDNNFDLVQTAFDWIKKDKNVVYTAIVDESQAPLIEYNPQNNKIDRQTINSLEYDHSSQAYKNKVQINYKGKNFGSILMMYSMESAQAEINNALYMSLVAGFIILILGTIFILFISNKISKGIISLRDASQKASEGDLEVHIKNNSNDEVGALTEAFNKMVLNIKAANIALDEEKKSVEQKVEMAVEESEHQKKYLSDNVKLLLENMDKLAQGDLTVSLPVNSSDDIGNLFAGFNKTVENLKYILTEILVTVESTGEAIASITLSTEQMSSGAKEQSMQTTEAAGAMEEMTKTIVQTADNASMASNLAKDANRYVNVGTQKVAENKNGILRIIDKSDATGRIIASLAGKTDQIGSIAQTIDEIADQTNLLALNAAIEAARAGEQGRGFAVVADEVRKLAERTTKATKEIAETIKAIQVEAKDADKSMFEAKETILFGQKLTDEVAQALNGILESIEKVSIEIEQVATASVQQSSTSEEISQSIESINSVINKSAEGIQQIATSSNNLLDLSNNLREQVSRFKLEEAGNKDFGRYIKPRSVGTSKYLN